MAKLGIIADDLTGATTVGVLLARSGISTAAFFDTKGLENDKNLEAIVLSSDSRALNKALAVEKVKESLDILKSQNVIYFSKRIDTTMRGGIGFEVDAMLEELDNDTIAIMVPAMPQSNRIVVGGYSIINGVALSKTGVANDVRTPVNESYIKSLYEKQTQRKIGQVHLKSILEGKESIKKDLINERKNGSTIIIVDAITMDDVDLIAQAILELEWNVLAIDPGPFTESLAVLRGLGAKKERIKKEGKVDISRENGKIIAAIGSATSITKKQIDMLSSKEYSISVSINPLSLINEKEAEQEIYTKSIEMIEKFKNENKKVLIAETSVTTSVLNLKEVEFKYNLKEGEAAEKINIGLGKTIRKVIENIRNDNEIKGLYMTGGDTMVTILRSIGAKGIRLLDYVIPQTDLGTIIGGPYQGIAIVGKGGLTGNECTAIEAVEMLYRNKIL